jgi:ribosome-associated toxin RatA of RatAB toxin-antitoxin module
VLIAALLTAPRAVSADDAIPAVGVASGTAEAPAGGPEGLTVKVSRGPAGLEVEARAMVRAPAAVAWEVLTDYDGIDDFVSSMRESRVSGRGERHVLVEQVAVGRLFLFKRSMRATLFVEEIPPWHIRFEDVLGRDFESYHGEWRIEERKDGVEIFYNVAARPSFSVPDFIARGLFLRTATELLSQVRTEIERRAARPAPPHAIADTTGSAGAR